MSGQTADAYHRDISRRLLRADNTLTLSLLHVVLGSASIATCVLLAGSWMDSVQVHLGLDHYAESLSPLSTTWLPMPFNAVVNVGYVAVGVFWILHVRNNAAWMMRADEAYLMYVLAWMLVLYGPVQLVRILSHWRAAGILDQWFTLPIFAWVGVACYEIGGRIGGGQSDDGLDFSRVELIVMLSVTSYGLALVFRRGFELALAAHIFGVVAQAWRVCHRGSSSSATMSELHRRRQLRPAFVKAVLCCIGFVTLKLADWPLVHQLPVPFAVLSGHFWSKVADFLQAHFACRFLEDAMHANRLHSVEETLSTSDRHKYN